MKPNDFDFWQRQAVGRAESLFDVLCARMHKGRGDHDRETWETIAKQARAFARLAKNAADTFK